MTLIRLPAHKAGLFIKHMKDTLLKILLGAILIAAIGGGIYGCYAISKKLSYEWWYEDMVEQTVREMVKPEHLNPDYR